MAEKVPQPKWIFVLQIIRILVAIIVLGLCGYTLSLLVTDEASFNTFVAIWTILVGGYVLMAELLFSQIYHIWAILAVETLTLLFWLVGFALLGSIAATLDSCLDRIDIALNDYYGSSGYDDLLAISKCAKIKDFLEAYLKYEDINVGRKGQRCLAAGAGVGAICFVLSVIIVVVLFLAFKRHRDGATSQAVAASGQPGLPPTAGTTAAGPEKTAYSTIELSSPTPTVPPSHYPVAPSQPQDMSPYTQMEPASSCG